MRGQLYERPPGGGKWQVRVYLGLDTNGKRRYHNKLIHGTKKEASQYLTRVLRELDTGRFVEPSRMTVGAYLDEWIEVGKPSIRERTRASYKDIIRRYIKPRIGNIRLDRLSPADVQRLYNYMLHERSLATRTVRYTHAILHSALQQAVRWAKLARNPAAIVELPLQERREMRALTPSEVARFIKSAEQDRWYVLWLLLLTTGLRPGEALGLKWSDLSEDGSALRVQRVLVRIDGRGWDLKEPKTSKSRRVVTLPGTTSAALKSHRTSQVLERLQQGAKYEDHGFVFATRWGRPLDYRVVIRRHFKRVVRDAGLGALRPYDLRHTCATLLLAAGEHPKVVSERLGHASIVMTLDVYSHVLPDMQQAAAEKLEAIIASNARSA